LTTASLHAKVIYYSQKIFINSSYKILNKIYYDIQGLVSLHDISISSTHTFSKLFPRLILAVVRVSRLLARFHETKKSLSQEASQLKGLILALPKKALFSAAGRVFL